MQPNYWQLRNAVEVHYKGCVGLLFKSSSRFHFLIAFAIRTFCFIMFFKLELMSSLELIPTVIEEGTKVIAQKDTCFQVINVNPSG